MARHVRSGSYGDGMFYFTQPVGAGGGYGDGMFYFTQPVGAGGAYGDGGFFFTQPVGAGGGYAGSMRNSRPRGFVHPAAARSNYGVTVTPGRIAGLVDRVGGSPSGGSSSSGGTGGKISKADLDEIETLARTLGSTEYWYMLRTRYLDPAKRTFESYPVINSAGTAEGTTKKRDSSKMSTWVKLARDADERKMNDAKEALDNKLRNFASSSALDAFVTQARRNGGFDTLYRGGGTSKSRKISPTVIKLILMDAGVAEDAGTRTKENAIATARDYVRMSAVSGWSEVVNMDTYSEAYKDKNFKDAVEDALDSLEADGIDVRWFLSGDASGIMHDVLAPSFYGELKSLRAQLDSARTSAADALKATRTAVETGSTSTPSTGGGGGGGGPKPSKTPKHPEDIYKPGKVEDVVTSGGAEEVAVSEDGKDAVGEESFFVKYRTPLLVGGVLATILLFRKQLGIGVPPAPVAPTE